MKSKNNKKASLQPIAEENSDKSDLSSIKEQPEFDDVSEISSRQDLTDFPNILLKESKNEKITSVRKEIYKLSQYITSKEKIARKYSSSQEDEEFQSKVKIKNSQEDSESEYGKFS